MGIDSNNLRKLYKPSKVNNEIHDDSLSRHEILTFYGLWGLAMHQKKDDWLPFTLDEMIEQNRWVDIEPSITTKILEGFLNKRYLCLCGGRYHYTDKIVIFYATL